MSSYKSALEALGEAVQHYQSAVDDFDRETARVLGVNETDLRCLEILMEERDEVTPRVLADRLNLTTGSVTTMLDRLERLDYVRRAAHASDRRKVVVVATPDATRLANDLIGPLVAEGTDLLRRHYDVNQLALIAEFLTRTTELQRRHTERLRRASG